MGTSSMVASGPKHLRHHRPDGSRRRRLYQLACRLPRESRQASHHDWRTPCRSKRRTVKLFTAIYGNRISGVVVDQIRSLIRDGLLHPGDRLPSERKLCEQFGVARVTIREAMRVLEAYGLVERRVGSRGGAFVTNPSAASLADRLANLIKLAPLTASDVTEARLIFEVCIMPTVVERATNQDIADLRALTQEHIQAASDGAYTSVMSAQFHNRIAAGAHNAALETLMRSFHGPLRMSSREPIAPMPPLREGVPFEHRDIVEAVASGDVMAAAATMRGHIERVARRMSSTRTTSATVQHP